MPIFCLSSSFLAFEMLCILKKQQILKTELFVKVIITLVKYVRVVK